MAMAMHLTYLATAADGFMQQASAKRYCLLCVAIQGLVADVEMKQDVNDSGRGK